MSVDVKPASPEAAPNPAVEPETGAPPPHRPVKEPLAVGRRGTAIAGLRRALWVVTIAGGVLLGATIALTLPWRWIAPPTTSFIMIKGEKPGAPDRRWTPWGEISPHIAIAVVAAEDQKFASHRGFDVESIRETLTAPEGVRRGASTISQQVAKNLYLWPGRSWARKGLEAYFTVFIEALWPKKRILEVYLNVVEFGPGVYGVAAASETYFGASPAHVSPYQAALLAAVLPSPHRMSPGRPSAYVHQRAAWILDQTEQLGGASYLSGL